MTDNTQELDEILHHLNNKMPTPVTYNESKKRTDDLIEAKQAILDWHNKQVEEVLDRLDKYLKDEISIRPRNAIEAERERLGE